MSLCVRDHDERCVALRCFAWLCLGVVPYVQGRGVEHDQCVLLECEGEVGDWVGAELFVQRVADCSHAHDLGDDKDANQPGAGQEPALVHVSKANEGVTVVAVVAACVGGGGGRVRGAVGCIAD